jgi:hypothetical protein
MSGFLYGCKHSQNKGTAGFPNLPVHTHRGYQRVQKSRPRGSRLSVWRQEVSTLTNIMNLDIGFHNNDVSSCHSHHDP